jgi:hypothetical protein
MKKTILLALLFSATSFYGSAQTDSGNNDPHNRTVHGTSKTARFGDHPAAVADYLTAQHLLAEETIVFKRAVFRLLIDPKGNVTEATLFYGGISVPVEEKIVAALLAMPAWTPAKTGEQSRVYLVVQIKEQVITTELY